MTTISKTTAKRPRQGRKKLVTMTWLDPDAALNFAYAIHAADDEGLRGTVEGRQANRQADKFSTLSARRGTPDWEYLTQVENIVLSHARSITRDKKAQLEELKNARIQYQTALQTFRGSRSQSNLLNILYSKAGMRGIVMALSGGIGYFFAQTVGPFLLPYLPEAAHSGQAPSLLLGLIFAGVSRIVSAKMSDFSQTRIEGNYQSRCQRARLVYEENKLEGIQKSREWLCMLWKQYMGEEYPETPSYALVIKAEINTEKGLQAVQNESQKSDFQRLRSHLWFLVWGRWKGRENRRPAVPTTSS